MTTEQRSSLDHLVVMAPDLASGVAWCEATLGITPGPGGEHPLMGSHNRLLRIDGPAFPGAYLEIIAINPKATPLRAAPLKRWFDMDDAALMQDVARNGPRLCHWVARVPHLSGALQSWLAQGLDAGSVLQAQRPTPQGLLQWHISVRDDGVRLMQGCLPTLIQWGEVHPAANMADSGLVLSEFTLMHPQAPALRLALDAAGVQGVHVQTGQFEPGLVALQAVLQTPRGEVVLSSLV